MRKLMVLLFGTVGLAMAANGAADAAQVYPPGTNPAGAPTLTAVPARTSPGSTITITARNFTPGKAVEFTVSASTGWKRQAGTSVGSVLADASGTAVVTTTAGPAGTYVFTGSNADGQRASDTVTVVAQGGIPSTGSDSGRILQVAALVVLVGGSLAVIARRRRRAFA